MLMPPRRVAWARHLAAQSEHQETLRKVRRADEALERHARTREALKRATDIYRERLEGK